MSILKAPYNFVPLSKQVVTPEWGSYVSHDVPFEDAQSGELEVEIEAFSPIYVRDGQPKGSLPTSAFAQTPDGQYFIPGSSIKGMVRAVLEIMTFGKMGNKADDKRYAIRDLSGAIKELYLSKFKPDTVFGGWLKKNDGDAHETTYIIEDCDQPGRISHRHLDEIYGTDFAHYFQKGGGFLQNRDEQKAARFKYRRFQEKSSKTSLKHRFTAVGNNAGRPIFEIDPDSGNARPGQIVFTGQPGPRFQRESGKWEGHHLEFIFFDDKKRTIPVKEEVIQNFFFAYFEHDEGRQSVDWKYWRKELNAGQAIPVFFHKNAGEVTAIGLSYLFKLPYQKSIKEAMPSAHQNTAGPDFSELIFGFVQGDSDQESLKGRVHVGHASASVPCVPEPTITAVLSSPKASYYPNYVRQAVGANGKIGSYQTLMDSQAEIAGWKRYPIHAGGVNENPPPIEANGDLSVQFTPIKAGAKFRFKIHYHNLKAVELGALLSAISFHQHQQAFHSLGMAKPLGYGKVKLHINSLPSDKIQHYLSVFEAYMQLRVKDWLNSTQISNLLSMACEQTNIGRAELSYMKLGVGDRNNQFTAAKNEKEALDEYIKLPGVDTIALKSQLLPGAVQKAQQEQERLKSLFQSHPDPDLLRNQEQLAFYKALEEHKAQTLEALRQRKEATLSAEREKAKAEKQRQTQQQGLDLSGINIKQRDAFEVLKKLIRSFVEAYHNAKYDKLLKEGVPEQGLLPENDHASLIEKVQQIVAASSKKDRESWQKSYDKNAELKKVGEWIGVEKARNLKF